MLKASFYFIALFCPTVFAKNNDKPLPQKYWDFMAGYEYKYPKCTVSWSERTASFLVDGEGCNKISSEMMKNDTIKSIDYVRKNSSFTNFLDYNAAIENIRNSYSQNDENIDAERIWERGCLDFKEGLNIGDFSKTYNPAESIKKYDWLKINAVINLYSDGWNYARLMKGIVDCSYYAALRAREYVSGIDIRN